MSFYEDSMRAPDGLTSSEALAILIEECEEAVSRWKEKPGQPSFLVRFFRSLHSSSHPCAFHLSCLFISSLLIAIGAVDLENEISHERLLAAICLFIYSLFIVLYIWRRMDQKENSHLKKVQSIVRYLRNTKENFGYSHTPEPLTEDMWGQTCLRNGHLVNVPKVMVVRGDLVLLRPGQIAPCSSLAEDGTLFSVGDKVKMDIEVDKKTGAYRQLKPIRATCMESPVVLILQQFLNKDTKPSKLSQDIEKIVHLWVEKYVLIPYTLVTVAAVAMRYFSATSDSYFGTRFVFSIPALIILPVLVPALPLILGIIHYWNNAAVCSSLGVAYEPSEKDLLDMFSRLTGVSVVDKKGILSSSNPCIDKIIVTRYNEESYLVPETMGLSSEMLSEGRWKLYFDDPGWQEAIHSLRPLGLNLQLNSCAHGEEYISFLDHLTVVSPQVPRTIVTANRRCMCQLPELLGFHPSSCLQFLQTKPKTLCFYKRQPGEAPLHGLTKHRTPMEMAFCTVHSDISSNHGHVSCQGTADVVLDACTHLWDGDSVVPLSSRVARQIRDIYQRNSMTGYCLLLSYRPTNATVSEALHSEYIEVPLAREETYDENVLVRSLSTENIPIEDETKELETAEEVIENIMSGQILCGLVAMQYEALPSAVQLVEALENNCIRFVYFSRENELRSRVFAEKLGLEAGWNCHISLAEPTEDRETSRPLQEVFLSTLLAMNEDWERLGSLRKDFLSKSESYLIEEPEHQKGKSPFRKRSSTSSVKVGAMPNKAQLPTGVSRVRPHLEEVDNVPLLVGLFTDCDPDVNKEMLIIMQENEEVVLTVGSSLNISNTAMFIQSDLSVCVPPLSDPNCSFIYRQPGLLTANDIAARLLSITTDFELNHQQLLNISATVTGSRHRIASIRSALLFVLMASAQFSLLLLSSALLVLPLIFTTSQVFLTAFVQIPLLCVATIWTPFTPKHNVIRIAAKNQEKTSLVHHLVTFSIQFLPSIIVLLATFFISLAENATLLCAYSDVVCSFGDDLRLSTEEIRHIVGLHFILYLVTNSIPFVFPLSLFCWQLSFATPAWIISSLLCISLQIGYSYGSGMHLHRIMSYPSMALAVSWIIIMAILNEICKMKNIRTFLREQRRTKLAFDTKLGMNSPY